MLALLNFRVNFELYIVADDDNDDNVADDDNENGNDNELCCGMADRPKCVFIGHATRTCLAPNLRLS